MAKELKDYRIKETLSNMNQKIDNMRKEVFELKEKFEILVEILNEREEDNAKEAEEANEAL